MVRKLTVLALVLVAAALVEGRAFQSEGQDSNPYEMLEQLEKFYSQVGRPRVGRRGEVVRMDPDMMRETLQLLQLRKITDLYKSRPRIGRRGAAEPRDPERFESALRLLQLQSIDRYSQRPRYGKRSDSFPSWVKSGGDIPDDAPTWLAVSRRR